MAERLRRAGPPDILPSSYTRMRPLPHSERLTTIVSTKGQVILPKAIRERRDWNPGTRLLIEDTADGVHIQPCELKWVAVCDVVAELDELVGALPIDPGRGLLQRTEQLELVVPANEPVHKLPRLSRR